MKRKFVILLLLFVALAGYSQEKECFALYTDHDLCTSGETLLIKTFAPSNEQTGMVTIDLVNSEGKIITKINLELIDHQADGCLYLPDSLSSGYYMLRTSTRSSRSQTIKELFIASRFTGVLELNEVLRPAKKLPTSELQIQTIRINGIMNNYKQREKGIASIQIPDDLLQQIEGNIHVNIARAVPQYHGNSFIVNTKLPPDQIIEKEGIILEGIVTDLKTAQPFRNAVVYLSISDSIPVLKYYLTRDDGRFYFQIKGCYGKIPVVIQCIDRINNRLLKIALTDSETGRSGLHSFEKSTLPAELKREIAKNREAVTIRKIFNQQEIALHPATPLKPDFYPFYGIPNTIVYPKLYTDLPDFSEISRELLPGVKFRTYNRLPSLQVVNSATHTFFNTPPLVLLDGIPVTDLNVIKNMGSVKIERIEICTGERFFGDLIFQGVVAIYSAKPIETLLPDSDDLIKIIVEGIQPQAKLNLPPEPLSTEPDLRNTLLWEPSLKPNQTIQLNFQVSDIKGSYKVIIRGKTTEGKLFFQEQIFEVN